MKNRTGFVSNSSTSSFVIAMKPNAPTKIKVSIEVDLADYINCILKTQEDVEAWLKEQISHMRVDGVPLSLEKLIQHFEENPEDEYWLGRDYKKYKEIVASGKVVCIGEFSSYGDGGNETENMLCNTGLVNLNLSSDIDIIQGEGGY